MATALKNMSENDQTETIEIGNAKFGIVVSDWNSEVTDSLLKGTVNTLRRQGVRHECIMTVHVPGSFELTGGATMVLESTKVDAVICLGCVIQGETRHFDFICQSVGFGLTELNIRFNKPVIFGVLTTDNLQQAKDRAGGKHGNKGDEAAYTAIKMVALKRKLDKLN